MKTITHNSLDRFDHPKLVAIFSADWCDSCHRLIDELEKVEDQIEGILVNVDVDENEMLSEDCHITSLPTIIVFKNGQPCGQLKYNCSIDDLVSMINDI